MGKGLNEGEGSPPLYIGQGEGGRCHLGRAPPGVRLPPMPRTPPGVAGPLCGLQPTRVWGPSPNGPQIGPLGFFAYLIHF